MRVCYYRLPFSFLRGFNLSLVLSLSFFALLFPFLAVVPSALVISSSPYYCALTPARGTARRATSSACYTALLRCTPLNCRRSCCWGCSIHPTYTYLCGSPFPFFVSALIQGTFAGWLLRMSLYFTPESIPFSALLVTPYLSCTFLITRFLN